jgi:adenosylmethionine-8-amino-7-oxononanoate aminotransferase
VAAFIGEPIGTPKGAAVPGDEYWPMVREICTKYGVLLIADEVVNGFGRTGRMFGSEHWDLEPDLMAVAKGIVSSYVPLGAAIATEEVAGAFVGEGRELRHVFTFTGHPVASAAGLKNIEIIETEGLVENAAVVGAYFKEQLEGLMIDHPIVGDVRGIGMIVAAELVSDRETKASFSPDLKIADRLNESFRNSGLLYRMSGDVIGMNPPLCITRDEVDEIVHAVDLALWKLEGELGLSKPL